MALLKERELARPPVAAARRLLGCELRSGSVVLRISETEAYGGTSDSAAHTFRGKTPRNAPMWGPPGRAYVYLCYGIHHLLNVVVAEAGTPGAVLIRSCELLDGESTVRDVVVGKQGPVLLTGPGKVGQSLGLTRANSGDSLVAPGGLELHRGPPVAACRVGPRVGIGYADPKDQKALWRFALPNSAWVSVPKALSPEPREQYLVSAV